MNQQSHNSNMPASEASMKRESQLKSARACALEKGRTAAKKLEETESCKPTAWQTGGADPNRKETPASVETQVLEQQQPENAEQDVLSAICRASSEADSSQPQQFSGTTTGLAGIDTASSVHRGGGQDVPLTAAHRSGPSLNLLCILKATKLHKYYKPSGIHQASVNITDTIMLNDMKPEERELYTQTVKSLTNPDAEVEPRIRAATLAYHRLAAGQSRLKLHRGAAGDLPGLISSGDSLCLSSLSSHHPDMRGAAENRAMPGQHGGSLSGDRGVEKRPALARGSSPAPGTTELRQQQSERSELARGSGLAPAQYRTQQQGQQSLQQQSQSQSQSQQQSQQQSQLQTVRMHPTPHIPTPHTPIREPTASHHEASSSLGGGGR